MNDLLRESSEANERVEDYKQELSYEKLQDFDFRALNQQLAHKDTMDIIHWTYDKFDTDIVYACSFGAEGIVLIDLISKVRPVATIVFLDTNFHFKETYELINEVQRKYPRLKIEMLQPSLTPEEQAEKYGVELWKSAPDHCCHIRKVLPLQKRLSHVRAWVSGLRREESPSRAQTEYVNQDHRFKSIKICPLIHWTWQEVWDYIRAFDLPYNPLHDQGYPSIGCENCTLPVENNQDIRAGRWAGVTKTECGLHQIKGD